jgi:acyl carrier protein phosphodiesterase
MNYLAHLFLAKKDPYSMVGNLMGDFMKGVDLTQLPSSVVLGIQNHQMIDAFTDKHQKVCALKICLSPERKRFSGIITDVMFDYYLIKHWQKYSKSNFNYFVDEIYRVLMSNITIMPKRMKTVVRRMVDMDWLRSYGSLEIMGYVLDRMSQRIRFENSLSGAIDEVVDNYNTYENAFLHFFPQLMDQVRLSKIEG